LVATLLIAAVLFWILSPGIFPKKVIGIEEKKRRRKLQILTFIIIWVIIEVSWLFIPF